MCIQLIYMLCSFMFGVGLSVGPSPKLMPMVRELSGGRSETVRLPEGRYCSQP